MKNAITFLCLFLAGCAVRVEETPVISDLSSNTTTYYVGKYGFLDTSGEWAIKPSFDDAGSFSDGLACAQIGGKWGYVDKKGVIVIQPQFEEAGDFHDGLAPVNLNKPDGTVVTYDPQGHTFEHGRGKWGYIDKSGSYAISPQFDYARAFSENRAWIGVAGESNKKKTVKWGVIDRAGKIVVEPKYDYMEAFCESMSLVGYREGEGRKYGYIDLAGKEVIPPQYAKAQSFSEGLACVFNCPDSSSEGKWGFIDKNGKVIIKPQFAYDSTFSEGIAVTYDGCIDNNANNVKINRPYGDFHEGLATIDVLEEGDEYSKLGFMNRKGEIVIKPQFIYAGDFSEGLAAVSEDEIHYYYINNLGEEVTENTYREASEFSEGLGRVHVKWTNEDIIAKYLLALVKGYRLFPSYIWKIETLGSSDIQLIIERANENYVSISLNVENEQDESIKKARIEVLDIGQNSKILFDSRVKPFRSNVKLPVDTQLQIKVSRDNESWLSPIFDVHTRKDVISDPFLREELAEDNHNNMLDEAYKSELHSDSSFYEIYEIDSELVDTLKLIHRSPSIFDEPFSPMNLIQAVNRLHEIGKDKTIEALMLYDEICSILDHPNEQVYDLDEQRINFILHLLFVLNDNNRKMPYLALGFPRFRISSNDPSFPNHPFALVDDIPFKLSGDYFVLRTSPPTLDIVFCQKYCRLRDNPLTPSGSPVEALEELLSSQLWSDIFEHAIEKDESKVNALKKAMILDLREQASQALIDVFGKIYYYDEQESLDCVYPSREEKDVRWHEYRKSLDNLNITWDLKKQTFIASTP